VTSEPAERSATVVLVAGEARTIAEASTFSRP
jgi:hypothetical protein